MLAETTVTQRSPCNSAVSSFMTNPLPDCSNYSPFCHTHHLILDQYFLTSLSGQTLYQAALLETSTSLLQRFTVKSSRELIMSMEEYYSVLRKLNNKHRQVVMNCHLNSLLSLSLFSLSLSSLCSLSHFTLFSLFLISPSLSTIPSFFSDQFFVLLR